MIGIEGFRGAMVAKRGQFQEGMQGRGIKGPTGFRRPCVMDWTPAYRNCGARR